MWDPLTFGEISENLLEQFFLKFKTTVILGQNGHLLSCLAKFGQNENVSKKAGVPGRAIFLPLLSSTQLHAEFQINCLSRFQDQFVTSIHLDKGDIIGPVAFTGSTSIYYV